MDSIRLADIVIDEKLIVRDINEYYVGTYKEAMKAGCVFPPVILDRKNRLVSGHHRYWAYKRLYGDDHEVSCEYTPVRKDVELLALALTENIRNGYPMSTFEKKKALKKLEEFGASVRDMSALLAITEDRVIEWQGNRAIMVGGQGKKPESVPLKRGFEHLIGQRITEKEYQVHLERDQGVPLYTNARTIINLFHRNRKWLAHDDRTLAVMLELRDCVNEYLEEHTRLLKGA